MSVIQYRHVMWSSRFSLLSLTVASGLSQSSEFPRCVFCSHLFFIVAECRGRYHHSLTEEYKTCPCNFVQCFFIVPSFVRDSRVTLASPQARGSHLYFNGNSPRVHVYHVLKSLFLLQDGDGVCELGRHTDTRVPPLFNWGV